MEKKTEFPQRANDVTHGVILAKNLLADEDTLSLSQFSIGREIGKGQFSQVVQITSFQPRKFDGMQ